MHRKSRMKRKTKMTWAISPSDSLYSLFFFFSFSPNSHSETHTQSRQSLERGDLRLGELEMDGWLVGIVGKGWWEAIAILKIIGDGNDEGEGEKQRIKRTVFEAPWFGSPATKRNREVESARCSKYRIQYKSRDALNSSYIGNWQWSVNWKCVQWIMILEDAVTNCDSDLVFYELRISWPPTFQSFCFHWTHGPLVFSSLVFFFSPPPSSSSLVI